MASWNWQGSQIADGRSYPRTEYKVQAQINQSPGPGPLSITAIYSKSGITQTIATSPQGNNVVEHDWQPLDTGGVSIQAHAANHPDGSVDNWMINVTITAP